MSTMSRIESRVSIRKSRCAASLPRLVVPGLVERAGQRPSISVIRHHQRIAIIKDLGGQDKARPRIGQNFVQTN